MPDAVVEIAREASRAQREGRLADAHQGYSRAVSLCRESGSAQQLIQTLRALAEVERDLGHGDQAGNCTRRRSRRPEPKVTCKCSPIRSDTWATSIGTRAGWS